MQFPQLPPGDQLTISPPLITSAAPPPPPEAASAWWGVSPSPPKCCQAPGTHQGPLLSSDPPTAKEGVRLVLLLPPGDCKVLQTRLGWCPVPLLCCGCERGPSPQPRVWKSPRSGGGLPLLGTGQWRRWESIPFSHLSSGCSGQPAAAATLSQAQAGGGGTGPGGCT